MTSGIQVIGIVYTEAVGPSRATGAWKVRTY